LKQYELSDTHVFCPKSAAVVNDATFGDSGVYRGGDGEDSTCNQSFEMIVALIALAISVGVLHDVFTGVMIALGTTVEFFFIAICCANSPYGLSFLETTMLAS
jgi:hypothetical protein